MDRESTDALRSALEAGDFVRAQPLVYGFAAALRAELASAVPQQRVLLLRDAQQILNQYLHLARAMRSHLCARLQALSAHSLYQAKRDHTHTWRLDG